MDSNNLMQAVLRSFLDAGLRVELMPKAQTKPDVVRISTGTGPVMERMDATVQAADTRYKTNPVVGRVSTGTGPVRQRNDATAQAVDGRYASMYKVHHCKMTPTSPQQMTTEFPPQRPEISRGCDNFQVGGLGSGEMGGTANKASCYRGGMTWASRGSVYSPRATHHLDPFASSLRKYPSISPERAEVLARLVTNTSATHSPQRYSAHSPPRHENTYVNYRCACKAYDETYARNRPRAPEECPTRDKRDESPRKQPPQHQPGDMRFVREASRKLRESLKSISSYTHTQTTTACTDGREVLGSGSIPDNSEQDLSEAISASEIHSYPVNSTVQAVPSTTSRQVETVPLPTPRKRSVSVPLSPCPSHPRLPGQQRKLPDLPTSRSVQTSGLPGRSVETTTSSVELAKHDLVQISKKSKSLSDIRLNWEVKSELLSWLDDTDDPNVIEIQKIVLRNLANTLKGAQFSEGDKITVKFGNCFKSRFKTDSKNKSEFNNRHQSFKKDFIRTEISSIHSDFEDVIKEWLSNISIKKRDILLRPVKKDQIYNTFVNRLKHLVVKPSEQCREQLLRSEITEILDEIPIEVNASSKMAYLEMLTETLMCKLESISRNQTDKDIKSRRVDAPVKSYLGSNNAQLTEKETIEFVVDKMADVFKKQNLSLDLRTEIIIDMVDILMNSVDPNVRIEEITCLLLNTTKLPENEASVFASELADHWRDIISEKYKNPFQIQPLAVFMIHSVPGTLVTKTSGTNVSQHNIIDKDIEADLHQYKIQLAVQIDRWLSRLKVLHVQNKDFRQAVILDLANDIVDRQKYLEFNKLESSFMDELEHLKYQIFKWFKRLTGENKMEAVNHASELMEMISNIPVPMFNTSQENLCKPNSSVNQKNYNVEPSTSLTDNNDSLRKNKSSPCISNQEDDQAESVFTNFVIQNVITNNDVRRKKQKQPSSSSPDRKSNSPIRKSSTQVFKSRSNTNVPSQPDLPKRSLKNQKNSTEGKVKQSKDKTVSGTEMQATFNSSEYNNPSPGPSGLVTPNPPSSNRPSSAAAKLMAYWRPPPVFTPPPPGRPVLGQIHEDFQTYLKTWVQQIPISTDTPDEANMAEKARLGIMNGIWKMMTKLKTQPAVFQNNFYYEDVLGKEIDGLLDCLPQSQELKEKRYMLKAQLLDKTSEMNDLIKELQTPENYREVVDQKVQEKKDESLRKVVKLDLENPSIMFEQMLAYCILDDFLAQQNYKEADKIKASAYRLKLLRSVQDYLAQLKATHKHEIEDILNMVKEKEIFGILDKVQLPTDDSIREDADEILLGFEIEQWMSNLPIVKNDDTNEQLQRIRLRDVLTNRLYELEKGVNVAPCCGDTQVKQEISFFLDKIPLEKNQDLRINDMVEELTNRLKMRNGGRRKSVAFQGSQQNQSSGLHKENFSNFSCSGADRLHTTGDKWAMEEDDEAEYRAMFRNDPICSSRIDQVGDKWAMDEGQDSQYKGICKDRPACSTMIEPQVGCGLDNNAPGPDFRPQSQSEQEPYYVYTPGQFHESGRGGAFGYPQHSSPSDGRYQYPGINKSSRDRYMSVADAHHAGPPIQASRHTAFAKPQDLDWEGQNESYGGFVSMADHHSTRHNRSSPHRSQEPSNMTVHEQEAAPQEECVLSFQEGYISIESNVSRRDFSNRQPKAINSHRSRTDPNLSQNVAAGLLSSSRHERSLTEQGAHESCLSNASRFSRAPNISSRSNRDQIEPAIMRETQNPFMLQLDGADPGYIASASHQPSTEDMPPPTCLETSARNQSHRQTLHDPEEYIEIVSEPPPEYPGANEREGTQGACQKRCPNVSASSPHRQEAENRSTRDASMRRTSPTDRLAPDAGNRAPRAPNEISDQPVCFSTPNQRPGNPPLLNIRERRQMEKERARRLARDSDEGEERCHCVERFRRWSRRGGAQCDTCDDCVNGGNVDYFPYPYPYMYSYPPFIRPPYPPYFRR